MYNSLFQQHSISQSDSVRAKPSEFEKSIMYVLVTIHSKPYTLSEFSKKESRHFFLCRGLLFRSFDVVLLPCLTNDLEIGELYTMNMIEIIMCAINTEKSQYE